MIRKSGSRFSEMIVRYQKLERNRFSLKRLRSKHRTAALSLVKITGLMQGRRSAAAQRHLARLYPLDVWLHSAERRRHRPKILALNTPALTRWRRLQAGLRR